MDADWRKLDHEEINLKIKPDKNDIIILIAVVSILIIGFAFDFVMRSSEKKNKNNIHNGIDDPHFQLNRANLGKEN